MEDKWISRQNRKLKRQDFISEIKHRITIAAIYIGFGIVVLFMLAITASLILPESWLEKLTP